MSVTWDLPAASVPGGTGTLLPNARTTLPTFTVGPTLALVGNTLEVDFAYHLTAMGAPGPTATTFGFYQVIGVGFTIARDPEERPLGLSVTMNGAADCTVTPGAYLLLCNPPPAASWWDRLAALARSHLTMWTGTSTPGAGTLGTLCAVWVEVLDENGLMVEAVDAKTLRSDLPAATPLSDCDAWEFGPATLAVPMTHQHHKQVSLDPGAYSLRIRLVQATQIGAVSPSSVAAVSSPALARVLSVAGWFWSPKAPVSCAATVNFSGPAAAGATPQGIRITLKRFTP